MGPAIRKPPIGCGPRATNAGAAAKAQAQRPVAGQRGSDGAEAGAGKRNQRKRYLPSNPPTSSQGRGVPEFSGRYWSTSASPLSDATFPIAPGPKWGNQKQDDAAPSRVPRLAKHRAGPILRDSDPAQGLILPGLADRCHRRFRRDLGSLWGVLANSLDGDPVVGRQRRNRANRDPDR